MNVTTTGPTAAGFLTVFPCDRPRPNASNLNFDSSAPAVANLVTVRTGDDGKVCFYASESVNVIADVQGYFADGPGVEFTSTSPVRILDTRDGLGVDSRRRGPLGRGETFVVHSVDRANLVKVRIGNDGNVCNSGCRLTASDRLAVAVG